jgi:hypothetical protein
MNQILKEKIARTKEAINDANNQLEIIAEKVRLQNKYITDVESLAKDQVRDKQQTIVDNQTAVALFKSKNEILSKQLIELVAKQKSLKTVETKKNKLNVFGDKFDNSIKSLQENRAFFIDSTACPTCSQEISEATREKHISQCDTKINEITETINKLQDELSQVEIQENTLMTEIEVFQNTQMDIVANNSSITALQTQINKLESEILKIEGTEGDIGGAMADLQAIYIVKERIAELKITHVDQQNYNFIASEMLKDTGIKTKIVKQYLPVINKLVNQYLQILDFFVLFNLDESFNETIKSRYRDEFTYASFSEGEKQRIDLSLLFTWRQIAKMKNSANTNLLILDETFDSSLDTDGIDNLMKILDTVQDTNVFVISHKGDVLDSKFRNKIEFIKERNFSRVK